MIIEFRDSNEPTEGLDWKVPLNRQAVYVWGGRGDLRETAEQSDQSSTFCISGQATSTTTLG